MDDNNLNTLFEIYREKSLHGRYIHLDSIEPLLASNDLKFTKDIIGYSVDDRPIYSLTIGSGPKKILMWSQMHGNESTTTKSVFDLLNLLSKDDAYSTILQYCTIKIIPMLNPDGAKAYTRLNANSIDLNRDALDLSQPESIALRAVFDEFNPDFCFNLHGQRTIYSAGSKPNSATVSFLAPAEDEERSITNTRKVAMEIIVVMSQALQAEIPDQVGRYDDSFNLNCVGDSFQSFKTPTILFEAGHYKDDYQREVTRRYIFQSLLIAVQYISENEISGNIYNSYFDIPENQKHYYDIIIRRRSDNDIAIQYEEKLIGDQIEFIPKIEKISNLSTSFGHKEINANDNEVFANYNTSLIEGNEIDFVSIKNEKFSLKLKKN